MNKIETFKYKIKALIGSYRDMEKSCVTLEITRKLEISDMQLEDYISTKIWDGNCLTSDQLLVIADVLDCSVDALLNKKN